MKKILEIIRLISKKKRKEEQKMKIKMETK
jgi:hypothetical protein